MDQININTSEQNYTLFVKSLLQKGYERFNLSTFSESQKKDIEKTAAEFYSRDFILEAIQTYFMLRNTEILNKIGEKCLHDNKNELAFEAFRLTENKEGLSKTGDAFLKNSEIQKAHSAFKLADNLQMISFIEKNFDKRF